MDTKNAPDEFLAAEQALRDAGIAYTVVAACPDTACELCAASQLPSAA